MLTLQPPSWNTEEIQKFLADKWSGLSNFGPLILKYPGIKDIQGELTMWSMRTSAGDMVLHPKNYPQCTAATASISTVQKHCGLITIGHLRAFDPKIGKLWMETVESYLYYLGYSTVMGCDGSSSLNQTRNFIVDYGGPDWQFIELGANRRMGNHTQSMFWKTIKKTIDIPWTSGAKQVTQA